MKRCVPFMFLILYFGLLLILPVGFMGVHAFESGWIVLVEQFTVPEARSAIKLSLITTVLSTITTTFFGTLLAYVLVRHDFRGKNVINAIVELPLALPPVVAGFMLILTFGPHSLMGTFMGKYGIKIIFATPGLVIALLFVTFPFVVRAVQSVLAELQPESEEAARTTGANGWQTFWHVTFPEIRQGVYTGATLSFTRALGAFGSVAVVSGMIIGYTQTVPLYVWQTFMDFNIEGAFTLSLFLGLCSFMLVLINEIIKRRRRCL